MKVRSKGPENATIVVIADTPTRTAWQDGKIMGRREMDVLSANLEAQGVTPREVRFITPSSPLPQEALGIEKKVGEWLSLHRDHFLQELQKSSPRLIIYLGKEAGRQLMGRPVKINSARGTLTTDKATGTLVLPLLSPRHVLRRPEVRDIFYTDIRTVGTLKAGGWDARVFRSEDREARYRWVTDLEFLLDDLPGRLSFDVETVGLHWYRQQRLLTTQFCWKEGESVIVPMDAAYIEGWRRNYHEALDNLDTDTDDYSAQKALLESQIKEMPKEVVTPKVVARIFKQVKALLGNQEVRVVGHNLKFDIHAMRNHGVKVANWYADTMQLAFAADDNMESKGLDDCIRRWVPAMAGYADAFNRSTDKSRMDLVPPHKMRAYACGDTDAVFRLAGVLVKEVRKDRANWNCFKRVQMPGLRAYVEIERVGFHLDREKLLDLGKTLTVTQEALYKEMLALVPAKVRRAELEDPRHKGKEVRDILSFTRPDFIRRCLFSPDGLALEPVVFTKTTRNETGEDRLPSTSAKDHLGHFVGEPLVEKIIEFGSLSTMRGRYVGDPAQEDRKIITPLKSGKWPSPVIDTMTLAGKPIPTARTKERVRRRIKVGVIKARGEDQWRVPFKGGSDLALDYLGRLVRIDKTEATGFWQYLGSDGADDIHPGYFLHGTVTGRTSSRDPNGQNLPKHGALAPAFRRIFKPTPGYLFLEVDLSQIELRLAAWVSGDPTMLHAYQTGKDLHALTAASTMGVPFEEFNRWKGSSDRSPVRGFDTLGDYYSHQRFLAKGVNFGFVYGMWHTTFREYAKATFKVDISPKDAERYRTVFFETYPRLETYHRKMKEFVRQHGFVRALHGALRRLPSIDSDDEGVQKETERQAINSSIQRFGSDLLVMSASRLVRDAPAELIRPCGTIHDSMILEVRHDYVEEGASAAKFYMESNPLKAWFGITPPIPLLADVSGPSTDLAEMKEMKVTAVAPSWYQPQRDL